LNRFSGGAFVIKVDQDKAKWVEVQTGRYIDDGQKFMVTYRSDHIVKTASEED